MYNSESQSAGLKNFATIPLFHPLNLKILHKMAEVIMTTSKKINILLATLTLLLPLSAKADIKIYFGGPAYKYHHYKPYSYYPAYKYHKYKRNRYYSPYSRHSYSYYSNFPRYRHSYSYSPHKYKKRYYSPYNYKGRHYRKHQAYERGFYDGLKYGKKKKHYSKVGK